VTAIARQYGLPVSEVLRWNGLGKHDRIRPGDRLRLTEGPASSDRRPGTR
jgi:LysM repeat protein